MTASLFISSLWTSAAPPAANPLPRLADQSPGNQFFGPGLARTVKIVPDRSQVRPGGFRKRRVQAMLADLLQGIDIVPHDVLVKQTPGNPNG